MSEKKALDTELEEMKKRAKHLKELDEQLKELEGKE